MKKLFLALALAFCAATVSAQGWGLGARVGAEGALFLKENGGIYAGVVGDAKFGIKFNKVPVKLAIDYIPGLGFLAAEDGGLTGRFINFGLSCVYCF